MIKYCDKHGEYECEIFEALGRQIIPGCPECEREETEREVREEQERKERAIIARFQRLGIEPEFYNKTLDDYKPETESERAALDATRDLEDGKIKKLLLLGDNGTGKTHLANALVDKFDGIRITMFELSCMIRSGYNEGKNEIDILDKILEHTIVVIDEIGKTKGSDAERNWMSYLVDKAHTRDIRLFFISNRKMARSLPAERRGEAFEYYIDNDVISRLRQNSKIVEVHGRDRRAATMAAV